MKLIYFFIIFIFLFGCKSETKNNILNEKFEQVNLKYAKSFEIYKSKNIVKIKVKNPWQKANKVEFEYFLTSSDSVLNSSSSDINFIKIPVNRVVCFSTTYIGFIDLLNKNSTIIGISGIENVYNKYIRSRIENKLIKEVGNDQDINYELILSLKPDVVFLYGIESEISSKIYKLNNLGIKTVLVAEYLEETPLAKTEWLKFFSLFFNDFEKADSLFTNIEIRYKNLLAVADSIKEKPKILINVPYNGIWYLPGGKSYMANFIKDAGGNYPWKTNEQYESFPLDFENIFIKSKDADILINPGIYNKIEQIVNLDSRISNINAITKKQVYNNNNLLNYNGGNDFWESGIVKPDLILKDLIKIFHQNIFFEDSLYFYRKLD